MGWGGGAGGVAEMRALNLQLTPNQGSGGGVCGGGEGEGCKSAVYSEPGREEGCVCVCVGGGGG